MSVEGGEAQTVAAVLSVVDDLRSDMMTEMSSIQQHLAEVMLMW